MNRSVLLRAASVFSVVAAMVPFMFALIRAVTTGSDIRYFWMALAAALGAVVVSVTAGRGRTSARVFGPAVTALLLATLLAGLTGYMLGARASVGILDRGGRVRTVRRGEPGVLESRASTRRGHGCLTPQRRGRIVRPVLRASSRRR